MSEPITAEYYNAYVVFDWDYRGSTDSEPNIECLQSSEHENSK